MICFFRVLFTPKHGGNGSGVGASLDKKGRQSRAKTWMNGPLGRASDTRCASVEHRGAIHVPVGEGNVNIKKISPGLFSQ